MDYLNLNIIPPNEIDMVDIEAKIEDLYMAAFRAIFAHDDEFEWREDKTKSKIIITSIYPEKTQAPFKVPHILFHNISYSLNFNNSLYRNIDSAFFDDTGYNNKNRKVNVVPYSILISIFGGKSESRNLANRVVNYLNLYDEIFNHLNLNIANLSKSATQASETYPAQVYETTIQISGSTEWVSNYIINHKEKRQDVLNHIETTLNLG